MYNTADIDLTKYFPEFKAIVLKHSVTLQPSELASYRNIAKSAGGSVLALPDLVTQAIGEVDTEFYESVEMKESLDEIDGQPVYFLPQLGVYYWPSPRVPFCIDLWLSYPAYPPGW